MDWLKKLLGAEESYPSHWGSAERALHRKLTARGFNQEAARKVVEDELEGRNRLAKMYRGMQTLNRQEWTAVSDYMSD